MKILEKIFKRSDVSVPTKIRYMQAGKIDRKILSCDRRKRENIFGKISGDRAFPVKAASGMR